MNCPNCGAEIGKHAKFCSNCGQKLSDVVDVADVEKTDALAESTEPAPETALDNSPVATEVIAPAETDDPVDTATNSDVADPDATVLAEYPADDEDTTAAETSLLEATADDSYISPDEAPTVVAGAGTGAAAELDPTTVVDPDAVADADADPTVIANSNAADRSLRPSLMTQIASTSSLPMTLIQLRFHILTHRSSPSFQADLAPLNASKPRTARTHSAKLPLACLQLSWL